jgi:D-tyrosyl-tRNA(Tyr) deacylase
MVSNVNDYVLVGNGLTFLLNVTRFRNIRCLQKGLVPASREGCLPGVRLVRLRIFDDENGLMNRSVQDLQGEILVVSQFTLFASTKKGNRPSFSQSARPDIAVPIYEQFVARLTLELGRRVQTGQFGAHMLVNLTNQGPVTIIIDSKRRE